MKIKNETVYVIEDWYDGPRTGYADYQQTPHFFRSLYLDGDHYDPKEDRFELTPVPERVVEWALASHQLWLRWSEAYRAGTFGREPAEAVRILPEDRAHNRELRRKIDQHWDYQSAPSFIVHGEFDSVSGRLEVRWREPDEDVTPSP